MAFISESLVAIIIGIFIISITAVYISFRKSYKFWSQRNIPYIEPKFPFGNVKSLLYFEESFGVFFRRLYNELKIKSKFAGGLYFLSKPILILIDPEIVKTVLAKDFSSFHNRDFYLNEEVDPLSAHLVALKDEQWRTMRAKLTPTFTSGKIKMMFETIKDCTKDLNDFITKHAEKNEPIDMKEILSRLTTDTIVSCAFGVECNSIKEPDNVFRKYGKKTFEFTLRDNIINALTAYPWILDLFKIPVTNPEVGTFFTNELKSIIEYREKNNVKRKDFLNLLIRIKNNQSVLDEDVETEVNDKNGGLTFNELAAQAFVFWAAGFETTSSTLNFALYELAINPDIQKKLRKEIHDVLQQNDQKITYDAVKSMKYMDQVVDEVLRKYPPLPILNRECTEDYYMPELGYTIKKGDAFVISVLGLHWDPEHYPEPDKFDPERFSKEGKSTRHPYTYIPFGEGPRICIGNRFALVQVKLVLSVLLKDFEFHLDPKTVTPLQFDTKNFFLSPRHTIWMQASVSPL